MAISLRVAEVAKIVIVLAVLAAALLGLGMLHSSVTAHAAVSTSYHHAMADVVDLPPGD